MTATIVDDLTDTSSNKSRECVGQGLANIASGWDSQVKWVDGCPELGLSGHLASWREWDRFTCLLLLSIIEPHLAEVDEKAAEFSYEHVGALEVRMRE